MTEPATKDNRAAKGKANEAIQDERTKRPKKEQGEHGERQKNDYYLIQRPFRQAGFAAIVPKAYYVYYGTLLVCVKTHGPDSATVTPQPMAASLCTRVNRSDCCGVLHVYQSKILTLFVGHYSSEASF